MNIRISSFNFLLIFSMALLMFLLWCASLLLLLDDHNRRNLEQFQQSSQSQVLQLQQNQQLWLQSQFYLLAALVKTTRDQQSFLWDYYQRNRAITAVNILRFDESGVAVPSSNRIICSSPTDFAVSSLDAYRLPRISSCRKDVTVLLEIAGTVEFNGHSVLLLVSLDFFSFVEEFAELSGRQLQMSVRSDGLFTFREKADELAPSAFVTILLENARIKYGQIELQFNPLSYWQLFKRQGLIVALLILLAAWLVSRLYHRQLIAPLLELAEKMRFNASQLPPSDQVKPRPIGPGLKVMLEYFNAMQKQARRDPLTGLNNRVLFEDRLLQAIREGKRNARKYALILINLGAIDDLAHQRGQYFFDAILKQVAARLLAALRETDNVSRFDHQLFAVLVEVQAQDQLISLVEKIYLALTQVYPVHGRDISPGVSIGIANYPEQATDAEELYQYASEALVEAEQSEWPIVFYRDEQANPDSVGLSVIQALRQAIDQQELKLVYQPVVNLTNHNIEYFEALLRWKDPLKHSVSIERTIQLAEQNQLIKPLTNWIFESVCRFISESKNQSLTIGINLSMIDLHDRLLPERIEKFLQRYQVKPAQIVIEITEGQIMQDPVKVVEVLAHLGQMGMSLSIDDFGTGQASLTYLREMPVEKLKIDQSFVRDIVTNPDDQLIVRATIELAHTLNLKVIAEGVETVESYDLLKEMNCDFVQGYYISRPLNADALTGWLEKHSPFSSSAG